MHWTTFVTLGSNHSLATEREEVQKQREYFARLRTDFLPDGRHAENPSADDSELFDLYSTMLTAHGGCVHCTASRLKGRNFGRNPPLPGMVLTAYECHVHRTSVTDSIFMTSVPGLASRPPPHGASMPRHTPQFANGRYV